MKKILTTCAIILLLSNLVLLDFFLFKNFSSKTETRPVIQNPICELSCPKSCLEKIALVQPATAAPSTNLSPTSILPTVTPLVPSPQTVFVTMPPSAAKEYYVNLGAGTGEGSDWKDVDNSEVQVNLSQFSNVEKIYFEVAAYLRNDNVTVGVRLYNQSDKQVVSGSEITISKLKCQTLTSSPISLSLSSKVYRLQVKATLGATVYIDHARLRLVAR